ncbi:ATP-dependent zinc protease family protein [Oceanobacter mangrovi]|uniref:ATP-dependent zinc protease family protein n=1 Tax=Oceanobacter mangrovi TaxID=2862510 RepID=UPI001C8E2C2D|nr:ATP-dependent zinc protease [Oceanobacter mangrovi]
MTKPAIGYLEQVNLPDLGVICHAKVDTGACSSSIHAENIEIFDHDGEEWVRFHILFRRGELPLDQICEAPVVSRKRIASSNGSRSYRYVIRTRIQLADQCWPIELNLSHRGSMSYPMLLGREAFAGRFVVDVEHTYLSN